MLARLSLWLGIAVIPVMSAVTIVDAQTTVSPAPSSLRGFSPSPRNVHVRVTPRPAHRQGSTSGHHVAQRSRPRPRSTSPWRPVIVVDPSQVLASPAAVPTPKPANTIKTSGPDVFEHYDTGQ